MSWGDRLRIAVLGAGGLGSKMGGLAAVGGADVWLIHRRPEHVAAIRAHGLVITKEGCEEQVVGVQATTDPAAVGPVDVVLVMVKAYDTPAAARVAHPLVGPRTLVVTFQNGLGSLEALAAEFSAEQCVLGVTFNGATLEGPGRVADKGRGPTYLAAREDTRSRLDRLAAVFVAGELPCEVRAADEVDGLLWGKLAMVSGINPVATVLRVPNGVLGAVPEARSISLDAIRETVAVAHARGVTLPFDPLERFDATTRATASMASGTLLDALRGRCTEIDAISGAIADEGDRLGVPTPVQRLLWRLVKAIEATHTQRVQSP